VNASAREAAISTQEAAAVDVATLEEETAPESAS
jgi:hypothetical protein